jgi:hypothetical protein
LLTFKDFKEDEIRDWSDETAVGLATFILADLAARGGSALANDRSDDP